MYVYYLNIERSIILFFYLFVVVFIQKPQINTVLTSTESTTSPSSVKPLDLSVWESGCYPYICVSVQREQSGTKVKFLVLPQLGPIKLILKTIDHQWAVYCSSSRPKNTKSWPTDLPLPWQRSRGPQVEFCRMASSEQMRLTQVSGSEPSTSPGL